MVTSNNSTVNTEPNWRTSKAKAVLQKLLENGEISLDGTMAPKDAWKDHCAEREEFVGFKYKNFANRLRALRKKVILNNKYKLPEPAWNHSHAQALLQELIEKGEVSLDETMSTSNVWNICCQKAEFDGFREENFESRLESMRKQIQGKRNRSRDDFAALQRDRILFPVPSRNHRNEPRWQGSEAERLLKLDIDAKRHETMKPSLLFLTKEEYHENYPLEVFRKHIHQEVRTRKFLKQYGSKK